MSSTVCVSTPGSPTPGCEPCRSMLNPRQWYHRALHNLAGVDSPNGGLPVHFGVVGNLLALGRVAWMFVGVDVVEDGVGVEAVVFLGGVDRLSHALFDLLAERLLVVFRPAVFGFEVLAGAFDGVPFGPR